MIVAGRGRGARYCSTLSSSRSGREPPDASAGVAQQIRPARRIALDRGDSARPAPQAPPRTARRRHRDRAPPSAAPASITAPTSAGSRKRFAWKNDSACRCRVAAAARPRSGRQADRKRRHRRVAERPSVADRAAANPSGAATRSAPAAACRAPASTVAEQRALTGGDVLGRFRSTRAEPSSRERATAG